MTESENRISSVLIVGCGYLGRRAARYWHELGVKVHAVTRSPQTAEKFKTSGWHPVQLDLASPPESFQLPDVDAVVWAVGFDRSAGVAREVVWVDGLRWLISKLGQDVKKFVYVSSTGVYGQTKLAVVDELSETNPTTEGGKTCWQAEQIVLDAFGESGLLVSSNSKVVILRHAGIYGPSRLLRRIDDLRNQISMPGNGEDWLNLIHVDDAVRLLNFVIQQKEVPSVINVVNADTVSRKAYYGELSKLSATPRPIFGGENGSGRVRSANKRVMSRYDYSQLAQFQFDDVLQGLNDAFRQTTIESPKAMDQ